MFVDISVNVVAMSSVDSLACIDTNILAGNLRHFDITARLFLILIA